MVKHCQKFSLFIQNDGAYIAMPFSTHLKNTKHHMVIVPSTSQILFAKYPLKKYRSLGHIYL